MNTQYELITEYWFMRQLNTSYKVRSESEDVIPWYSSIEMIQGSVWEPICL